MAKEFLLQQKLTTWIGPDGQPCVTPPTPAEFDLGYPIEYIVSVRETLQHSREIIRKYHGSKDPKIQNAVAASREYIKANKAFLTDKGAGKVIYKTLNEHLLNEEP